MNSRRWISVGSAVASALACWLACAPARAQAAANAAAAQALFDQGKKLMADGKTSEACPKFAESQRLDPGLGTQLNLAACYEAAGRIASAWSTFLEAESTARAEGHADGARIAHSRAEALAPKLSKIVINVVNGSIAGLEIKRDESAVGSAQWGLPIPADPGVHRIRASAPGRQPWSTEVELKDAAMTLTVTVPELAVDTTAAAPAPAAAAPSAAALSASAPAPTSEAPRADSGAGLGTNKTLAIALGVVGVAGIAVGSVFGLQSKSKHDEAAQHCDGADCRDNVGVKLRSDAIAAGNKSTVGFIIGVAGLAGGAVLWLTAKPAASSASAELGIGPGLVHVRGRF